MSRGQRSTKLGPSNWYIREWMASAQKIQADLQEDPLNWSKHKASKVFNLKQRYNEEILDELSRWLHVKPFELLLHPDVAYADRRMRADAARIANQPTPPPPGEAKPYVRTGTEG